MEKKTTQRIIGILVVVTLVVVLLPLLLGKSDATLQTANSKAPPFPAQQTTSTVAANSATNQEPIPLDPNSDAINNTQASNADITADMANNINEAANASTEQFVANSVSQITGQASSQTPTDVAENSPKTDVANPTYDSLGMTPAPTLAKTETNSSETHATTDQVSQPVANSPVKIKGATFKTSAWVIQMGYFKDKENARRLADKLRAAGYKAFMRDTKSSSGSRTRVLVGPEAKQASAVKLSTKLQQELKMHGIVMLFKPLEL